MIKARKVRSKIFEVVNQPVRFTAFGCTLNHFWKTCKGAEEGTNGYQFVKVMWYDVPGRGEEWKHETLSALDYDEDKFAQEYECVKGNTLVSVKNKETGEIKEMKIEDLYDDIADSKDSTTKAQEEAEKDRQDEDDEMSNSQKREAVDKLKDDIRKSIRDASNKEGLSDEEKKIMKGIGLDKIADIPEISVQLGDIILRQTIGA